MQDSILEKYFSYFAKSKIISIQNLPYVWQMQDILVLWLFKITNIKYIKNGANKKIGNHLKKLIVYKKSAYQKINAKKMMMENGVEWCVI